MQAEIIAVGSELLTAQRVDTNSLWLTDQLNALGVDVVRKSVVGDDRERLAGAIREALARVPILILSGGLGPTEDDLTRDAVAQALGRKLLLSDELLNGLTARYERMGRKMAEVNKRQAYLVEDAEALKNPNGSAPGQWLDIGDDGIQRSIMLLPGPPRELKPMFETECLPRLRERLPRRSLSARVYRVAGMPESDLDQLIAPTYTQYANPVTTILAAAGDVQIHLRAFSDDVTEADRLTTELGAKIEALLGDRIYARSLDPIEVIVGAMLVERGATLAVAESCTGGLLGGQLTSVPGASNWFLGGFLVYGTAMKTRLLGLDEPMVMRYGVVSEEVANAMADSARDRTGATYAISVTGEAGPESATPGIEPGTVWIGIATPTGVSAKRFRFPGNRDIVRGFAVQTALNLLRLSL